MFERFRRPRANASEGSVATRERETATAPETSRVERESPGERDRGVVAGGGDADLDDRRFEHDDMARGDTTATGTATGAAATDTALDRDQAREDLEGDDDRTGRGHPIAVGGAAAAGAAAVHHHHETERDEAARQDDLATHDDVEARDRTAVDDRPADFREHETAPGAMTAGAATTRVHDLDRDGVDDRVERHEPVLAPAALDTMRARQRDRFGGIQWGADFFGWLCAIGLASLLTAALVGAGVALGLSTNDATNPDAAPQIGLGGGIALIVALAIAWFCGGYVAGRMARFDGARQGLGVWLWTLLSAVVIAVVALIGGSEYDVYQRLNLPRIAIGDSTLNTGGVIAGVVAVVATLLFAVLGGKAGERFHKRVDRVATDEYVVAR
jgi:hypothetical protein